MDSIKNLQNNYLRFCYLEKKVKFHVSKIVVNVSF